MNNTAFTEMLGVLDDAIGLAETAVKSAEVAQRQLEPVTLVKVAAERCDKVATRLIQTGAFRDYSRQDLAKSLETAGPAGLLEYLEKLASRAVFPIDIDIFGVAGDLVEKSDTTRADGRPAESKTDLWGRCCAEAGIA